MPDGNAVPPFLPYGRQSLDDADIAAVADALRGDLLTTGPLVAKFEAAIAEAVGAAHAVVCSSGTSALHMAVRTTDVQPDEVCIVPAITFAATANAVRYEGAEVVFADVDPHTGLMTPQTLEAAIKRAGRRRIRAVLPVHLCGNPVDVPAIRALADQAGAVVIEDACHALGTETDWGGVGACALSALTCFSFHPVKTICTAEGGAVTTNDADVAARLKRLRNHGASRNPADFVLHDEAFEDGQMNPWWYEQSELGWNYRMPDVLCALGLSQIKKLPAFVTRRRDLVARYRALLAPLAPLVTPLESTARANPSLHLMVVHIDFEAAGMSRRMVVEALRGRGIGAQVHYIPVPRQPYYRDRYGEPDLPGADAFYGSVLSLPLHPGMRDTDPARVVEALARVLGL
jgi:UDP-4-amino-4,6-dideoxy-N-acetyl-beta-L-altrosamine transaminase